MVILEHIVLSQPWEENVHTAVTDLNPNFASGLLMTFLSEEDILRNGYDQAVGPCPGKKKWVESGDTQAFIPIDAIEGYLDVDLLLFLGEMEDDEDEYWDEPATINDGSHSKIDAHEVTMWLYERYPHYMGEQAKTLVVTHEAVDDEIRNFDEFPGVIGAQKYAQVRNPKICMQKRACRIEESHGKRGRKKTKLIPIFTGIDRNWRMHQLEFLMTY